MTEMIDVIAPVEQEGTKAIVKSWYKKIGETIGEGDPLVELETDKVAVEVPAPASGIVSEILIDADCEAQPGAVLGRLDGGGAFSGETSEKNAAFVLKESGPASQSPEQGPSFKSTGKEHRLSPSVRRLVQEHNLEPSHISGTGRDKRLTRGDVQEFLKQQNANGSGPSVVAFSKSQENIPVDQSEPWSLQRIGHDSMRRRIAEHMSMSVQTAPHVTAVFEADFSAIIHHRNAYKEEYLKKGAKLTFTTYIIAACVEAMKAAPAVNSRWYSDYIDIYNDINIGVGVALGEKGLVVPVVKQAQARSHFGVSKELQRLTENARQGKLALADVRGGTFSISNHGTSGSLVASPIIINQPQSAILGVGKLEKRVVVRTVDGVDAMQIRPMAFVSLTIDHRVLDGAQTNAWLTRFVEVLESWPHE